jgi:glycosyltransferase EpsE
MKDTHRVREISIIMGVHNGGRTVSAALESLRAQTVSDWECIICDDGSADDTWEILESYAVSDPRLILLRSDTNRGLGDALNRCVAASCGQYLARQDADDTSLPTRLQEQIRYLQQHPDVSVVGTYAALVGDNGIAWGLLKHAEHPRPGDWVKGPAVVHPSVVMRRRALHEVGGYDPSAIRLEDYDLWLRMLARGFRIATMPKALYRLHWDASDYARRRLRYRLGETRLALRALRLLHPPLRYYPYVLKPLAAGLIPRRLLNAYHVATLGAGSCS